MKTIIRGILAAAFLVISLILVQSEMASRLIETYVRVPVQPRAVVLALMGLAGLISDGLIFTLVRPSPSRRRRVMHALGMAGVFVLGFITLENVAVQPIPPSVSYLINQGVTRWPLILTDERVAVVTNGWPLIVAGGVGLGGYLLVSLIIRPLPANVVRLPRGLRGYLHDDEKALCRIQQTRLKEPITPDNLVATDQRLIVHHPTNLGFTSIIEDYNYIDIANVKIDRGWLFCTVTMKERFEGHDMVFEDMPKQGGEEFVRIVTEQIQQHRGSVPLQGQTTLPPPTVDPEAMRILQHRLARGEISVQEFEELRRRLSE